MEDVRRGGDAAVRRHERRFNPDAGGPLRLSALDVRRAYRAVSGAQAAALRAARSRLTRTESATMSLLRPRTTSFGGARVTRRFAPLRSVGCYVPGGLARYPSSAVMCVVPAKAAGVGRIAVASPPGAGGEVDPLTVVAADMCGADEIYRVGGAQAVAALAYGTRSIPAVDKIVGPGGPIVAEAKLLASRGTAVDMLAGPTELGIVADSSADPRLVALDLVSQAEHSRDASCYLITDSARLAGRVREELAGLVPRTRRAGTVRASLAANGFAAVCRGRAEMAELADALAPEHLQVMARDPGALASRITSPGLVLLGPHSPSAASDYMMGSNHVLPTGGSGAARGSLSALDFVKLATTASSTRRALAGMAGHVRELAGAEGLHAHGEAVGGRA